MKKSIYLMAILMIVPLFSALATTTSSTTRGLNIDGNIGNENGVINGTNGTSWEIDEVQVTSSGSGVNFYISWDDSYLYLGWEGGTNTQQHILWIDTDPNSTPTNGTGSSSTFSYGNVTATLPFTGNFFANIQSDYNEYRTNTSSSWSSGTSNGLTVFSTNSNDVEAKIAWNTITSGSGKPTSIYFLSYYNDPNGGGGTGYVYGCLPSSNSNSGGGAQSFTHYYGQNVNGGVNPFGSLDASLPVSLSKFSGQSMNGFVQLNWATDSEIENLGFNVYRSLADNPLELLASFTNTKSLEGFGSTNNYHEYSYNDNRVIAGQTYRYVLADVDYNGVEKRHEDRAIALTYTPNADEIKPVKFALSSAYPNPFNPSTTIQYSVPEAGEVAFTIYDLSGRELWSANEITTSAGRHQLTWSGLNTNGQLLPSGLYIVQMRAGDFRATQKLSLVR